jgi:arginase family enzyme
VNAGVKLAAVSLEPHLHTRLIPVRARISEQTPRDLVGVDLLAACLSDRGIPSDAPIEGRQGPFGNTPWQYDLDASRPLFQTLAGRVAQLARAGCCISVASDCAVAIATLPAVAAVQPEVRVLWLDAHSDYDTPTTTTYSFLGSMSLAGATGAWATGLGTIPPDRVVLCGARAEAGNFDTAAQAAVEVSPVHVTRVDELDRAVSLLGSAPVYVHLDTDVLDPADNPLPYARPGGLRLAELPGLLRAVAERGPLVGIEVTAFHAADEESERLTLAEALADAVVGAIGSRSGSRGG